MSGLDIAKALTEVDDSKFARVTYGVAQTASGDDYTDDDGNVIAGDENYVFVLLDGHTDVSKLRCDCYVAKGYRVKVVGDPSGRYLLYSMAGQVEELEEADKNETSAREKEDTNLQKQITAVENTVNNLEDVDVRQVGTNDSKNYPLLFKNSNNTDNETAQVRFSNTTNNPPTVNSSTSTITANTFSGNATSADRWTNYIQVELTGPVTGKSRHFNGTSNPDSYTDDYVAPLSTSINCGTGLTVSNNQLTNTGVTSISGDDNITVSPTTGNVSITSSALNELVSKENSWDELVGKQSTWDEAAKDATEALDQISSIEERTKRGVAQIVIYPQGDDANNLTDYTLENSPNYGSGIVIDRNANTYYVEPGYVAIQASCVVDAAISEAKIAHFQLTRYSAESGTTLGNISSAYAATLVSDEYGSRGYGQAIPITPMQILQLTQNTVFSLNSFDGTLCTTNKPYQIYIQYWKEI